MARNSQSNSVELKKEIERSRVQLERNFRGLRNELDFPMKIRRSINRKPIPWIASAAAVGIFAVILFTRRKKVYVEGKTPEKSKSKLLQAGFVLGVVKIAANLLKPVFLPFLEQKLQELSGRRIGSFSRRR